MEGILYILRSHANPDKKNPTYNISNNNLYITHRSKFCKKLCKIL